MVRKITQQDAATDEHHGRGGSYVVDADGRRVLVERTQPAERDLGPAPKPADAPATVTE